jgi:myosin heavy subunit
MGSMYNCRTPTAAIDIWRLIISDAQEFMNNHFNELIDAVQTMATKKNLTSLNGPCYWLSVACALCSLTADHSAYNVKKLEESFNQLFFTIFKSLVDRIKSDVQNDLVNIFVLKKALPASNVTTTKVKSWTLSDLIQYYNEYVTALSNYNVPKPCIQSLFKLILAHVNQQLVNYLFTHTSSCTVENGFNIKLNLSLLDEWLTVKDLKIPGVSRLQRVLEAATLISLDKQTLLSCKDSTVVLSVCPSLTPRQIQQLVENIRFDKSFGQEANPTVYDWFRRAVPTPEKDFLVGDLVISTSRLVSKYYPFWKRTKVLSPNPIRL